MKFDIEIFYKALLSICDFHGKLHCDSYILCKVVHEFFTHTIPYFLLDFDYIRNKISLCKVAQNSEH